MSLQSKVDGLSLTYKLKAYIPELNESRSSS